MSLGFGRLLFGVWAGGALLCGSVFTSFHQPFTTPQTGILALGRATKPGQWRALHFVSSSCGCSQKILQGLERRGKLSDIAEQILVIDSHESPLPGSQQRLSTLQADGFTVEHLDSSTIPSNVGLHGVPMLAIASPTGRLVYIGGYGPEGGSDPALIRKAQAGNAPSPKPILGCAVGARIRRKADPLRWKY
jgi:hypothetical protein